MSKHIKNQRELFGKNDKYIFNGPKKKGRAASTNTTPQQQSIDIDIPDGGDKLYFDATDQMDLEKKTPAPTPIPSSSNKTVSKKEITEFTNLNEDFSKRLSIRPLLSTIPKKDKLSSDGVRQEKKKEKERTIAGVT
ncbi:hypothetical protein RhiirA4_469737 [Rhizophagus irregularis]|uniref:Uncharacterized protein n=1 Tax=Rhizophagus irregularis TaxID=588596 RepID=A0A2I1H024_9GLOM|nr:hypothetical protein RhiirA4_469737 [Rhizophagus irregularis]